MKKILYTLIPMMLVACGGGKNSPQDGGHGIGIDSATVAQINAEDADDDLQDGLPSFFLHGAFMVFLG